MSFVYTHILITLFTSKQNNANIKNFSYDIETVEMVKYFT
jgi:hypothetical protein